MRTDYQFKLIDGNFSPEQARKVLIQMVNHKIDFHKIENFSNQIRLGGDQLHAKKRIADLERVREELHEAIQHAMEAGMTLEIAGTIEIKMTK